jgi:hypothetical protein
MSKLNNSERREERILVTTRGEATDRSRQKAWAIAFLHTTNILPNNTQGRGGSETLFFVSDILEKYLEVRPEQVRGAISGLSIQASYSTGIISVQLVTNKPAKSL